MHRFLCLLIALSCLIHCGRGGAAENRRGGQAVCVGVNKYYYMGELKYCANDAIAIKKSLEASNDFDYIHLLTEFDEEGRQQNRRTEPTQNNVIRTLQRAAQDAQPGDRLLFFFSGHGIEKFGKHFIVPLDGDESLAISIDEIKSIMASSRAESKMMMIDACRSGAGVKGVPGIRGPIEDEEVGMLVSCDRDQNSYEDEIASRGVFSLALEEALLGAADENYDSTVTGNEIYQFLTRRMRDYFRENNRFTAQTPRINDPGRKLRVLNVPQAVTFSRILPEMLLVEGRKLVDPDSEKADWESAREYFNQVLKHEKAQPAEKAEADYWLGRYHYQGKGGISDPFAAVEYWERGAELGDSACQFALGQLYRDESVFGRNRETAAKWLGKAAAQGHADAQALYAEMLYFGHGVDRDANQAMRYLRRLAGRGDGRAHRLLGLGHFEGQGGLRQDYGEAFRLFDRAVKSGDAKAGYWLGLMCLNGLGVEKDAEKAVGYFTRAGEGGDARSWRTLGEMYLDGLGVGKDPAEAASWLRRAADDSDGIAQFRLAGMYESGTGVPRRMTEAFNLRREALANLHRQADDSDADAQYLLGRAYLDGEGAGKDLDSARRWLETAAGAGNAPAQFRLGGMYFTGDGVEQDYARAGDWYRKAAINGNADAQTILGSMYFTGTGFEKNVNEARRWYHIAAEQGSDAARKLLIAMYYSGAGVGRDVDEAMAFVRDPEDEDGTADDDSEE